MTLNNLFRAGRCSFHSINLRLRRFSTNHSSSAFRRKLYNKLSVTDTFMAETYYDKGLSFDGLSFLRFDDLKGYWTSIDRSVAMEQINSVSFKPQHALNVVMKAGLETFTLQRSIDGLYYFLQGNDDVIIVNKQKPFHIKLISRGHEKYESTIKIVKSCNFRLHDIVDFGIRSEADCQEVMSVFNTQKGSILSSNDYYESYQNVCPKIMEFLNGLSSYYGDESIQRKVTLNILNWLIMSSFKGQSIENRTLTGTLISKVLCIYGDSGSGKSQLTSLFKMISMNNTRSGDFNRIFNRFESGFWIDSTNIVFNEVTYPKSNTENIWSIIKRLSGGDPETIEIKYGNQYERQYSGSIILCGQHAPIVPEKDYTALWRRLVRFEVRSSINSLKDKVNDFAKMTLAKELFNFTFLTMLLTGGPGDYRFEFINSIVSDVNVYSLDKVLLQTIKHDNSYSKFVHQQLDPLLLFINQFENDLVDRSNVFGHQFLMLFVRFLVARQDSKVIFHSITDFEYELDIALKSNDLNAWKSLQMITNSHVSKGAHQSHIKTVQADPGIALEISQIIDDSKFTFEQSIWENLITRVKNRINYLNLIGVKTPLFEASRKVLWSEVIEFDNLGNEIKRSYKTSVISFINLRPWDSASRSLISRNFKKDVIMSKPILKPIAEEIVLDVEIDSTTDETSKTDRPLQISPGALVVAGTTEQSSIDLQEHLSDKQLIKYKEITELLNTAKSAPNKDVKLIKKLSSRKRYYEKLIKPCS